MAIPSLYRWRSLFIAYKVSGKGSNFPVHGRCDTQVNGVVMSDLCDILGELPNVIKKSQAIQVLTHEYFV